VRACEGRRHSSTLPSVVVRVDMVRVEPLDEERGPAHPRAGEVRFHGDRRDAEDVERGSNVDSDAQNASSTRVGVMSDDDQSSGRDPRSSSASLALSTDSSVSHTPDASDAEDVERGSTVDSDAPPPADALDPTADEDRARAARPRSSSVWAFPPSAKHAGGRNAPNVLPVVSPPVKKDERKHPRGVGLCIRVIISLLLITNCVFLARIDDGIRTGGVNTNFWTTSSPPPPPPVSSPTTPASSPTTPSTFVSSPAGLVEYSVLTWEPTYHEGYGPYLPGSLVWWNPISSQSGSRYAGGSADTHRITSDRSFIDVARSKGITNYDIFTTCSWPNVTQSVEAFAGSSANSYAQTTNTFGPTTTGQTWNGATIGNRGCVVEKLVNTLSESGWTLLTSLTHAAFGSGDSSYVFTRQNATSS